MFGPDLNLAPIVQRFNPPGMLTDFNDQQKVGWHNRISEMFQSAVQGHTVYPPPPWDPEYTIKNNAPRLQFFNPASTAQAADLTEKTISWTGFPKRVARESATDGVRWKKADESRHVQDEYCEWSVARNGNNQIISVTFTCEGPEYWNFLAETTPNKVLELYQHYISPQVKPEDLFDQNGNYIRQNKWNRDTKNGAMHLIQKNNTLEAEVELAGGSSMVREKNGRILQEQQELIECGSYGDKDRNSDPLIGAEVNALARAGAVVSLRDPVGLYFDEFSPQGWTAPDNSDPTSYWKILRGTEDTPVRAIYAVPEDKGFTVSDIKINGKNIKYGSQIADFVRVKLVGIAQDIGLTPIQKFGCVSYERIQQPVFGLLASMPNPALSQSQPLPAWRFSLPE